MRFPLVALATAVFVACAAQPADEPTGSDQLHWDSADGNPTHPTHSILAEYAIKTVKAEQPEVNLYKQDIIDGANLELHDLKHAKYEALRVEIGGNNWAADHPELLWEKAQASYATGEKGQAFFYVGILLHYVQDMGVPAHAFHVIHQSGPKDWDHTELLAFFDFHGDLRAPGPTDSCSHLAVFSQPMASAADSSCAAVAEGASPRTDPRPCVVSQAARNARSVVVLPVPAGPTRTSSCRREVATAMTAAT